jgi:hypothetical protein
MQTVHAVWPAQRSERPAAPQRTLLPPTSSNTNLAEHDIFIFE